MKEQRWAENGINLGDYFSDYFCLKTINRLSNKIAITGNFNNTLNIDIRGHKPKYIFGRGFFYDHSENRNNSYKDINILCLRGILSKTNYEKCFDIKLECITGDPGILASNIYPIENPTKKIEIGFVPHWYDYYMYKDIINSYVNTNDNIQLIRIDGDKDIELFFRKINECEKILTSSLHGSVFAHSYNIPCCYVSMTNNLNCDRSRMYKFKDYYSNYNLDFKMLNFNDLNDNINILEKYNPTVLQVQDMKLKLLNVFNKIKENL